MQDQEKEHSQGERSEAHIHQKVWEYLFANEFSYGYKCEIQVSKFGSKLVNIREKGRQMAQFIGNSLEIHNPKAQIQIPM